MTGSKTQDLKDYALCHYKFMVIEKLGSFSSL